jgi:hypothetical protein
MIVRSPLKVAISQLYAREAFAPSSWYVKSLQSPFTDGVSSEASWQIAYNALRNQFWEISGDGLVLFQIEWVAVLLEDLERDPKSITFFSDNEKKSQLARGLGVKVITDLEELRTMKFDYLLKNAPYDKGIKHNVNLPFPNTVGPHSAFSFVGHEILNDGGICFDVLPCNFMCLPAAQGWRKWMLNNFEILNITLWDNSQRQVFDIAMSDIVTMVTRKSNNPKNNMVEWIAYNSAPFTVDLTRYDIWPMYKSPLSIPILSAVMSDRTKLLECDGGDHDKINPPPENFISGNLARLGQRQNPCPQKSFQKDIIKNIAQPIWLGYSTAQEKDYQFNWMATKHYAYVFSMIQSTPKNQPSLFALMGEHNFQDTDFNKHFNVTPTHDQEIEKWHNSIK